MPHSCAFLRLRMPTHPFPPPILLVRSRAPPPPPPLTPRLRTLSGWLMPGRSLKGSGKSMLNALLAGCLKRTLTAEVPMFFSTSCLLYSVPGTQLRHSSCSGPSRLKLRVVFLTRRQGCC